MSLISTSFGVTPRYSTLWRKIERQAGIRRAAREAVFAEDRAEAFRRLRAFKHFALAKRLRKEWRRKSAMSRADVVLEEVAEKHSIPVDMLRSAWRTKPVVLARHEVCYRWRTEIGASYPWIGKHLGGRDHTTALHGAHKHAERNGLEPPR